MEVHLDISLPSAAAVGEPDAEAAACGVGWMRNAEAAVEVHAAFSQPVKAAPRDQHVLQVMLWTEVAAQPRCGSPAHLPIRRSWWLRLPG